MSKTYDGWFVKVIVDTPVLGPLDYRLPGDMTAAVGDRVVVPLGTRRVVGIVVAVSTVCDFDASKTRAVSRVLSDIPPLPDAWLKLTAFAARYYVRTWGEAAMGGLPLFLKRMPGKRHEQTMARLRKPVEAKSVPEAAKPELTDEQSAVLEAMGKKAGFAPFLLFGVTGAGKTEVYLRLIEDALAREPGGQVLLLVPEINLTPQLMDRVKGRFPGRNVAVLHSELSDGERAAQWLAVHEGRADILVGTRTAIFASFKKLSLIIVDEEHDGSYKAGDGLRFHARDLAVWLARHLDIPVLLGSATPSLESWANAKKGVYECLTLTKRAAASALLPAIEFGEPPARGQEGLMTPETRERIEATLAAGRQVLVFMNRRGYSPVLFCPSCNWVSACEHCSTFTVFHKRERRLICHHCGYQTEVPRACPDCGNIDILPRGAGTERLEEELQRTFPDRRILRIDRDSVTQKHAAEKAFKKVHDGEVDILVGTQMVAKGHDFKNVGLVVILNADAQLLSPATRAREQLFATLMQVAGRAGRHGERGTVFIQTRLSLDPLFEALAKQDYPLFADRTLAEREANAMVPYTYQALLTAQAPTLAQALGFLNDAVAKGLALADDDIRLYDPVPMTIVRLMELERAQLLVECDERAKLNRFLHRWVATLRETTGVSWSLEVDPTDV